MTHEVYIRPSWFVILLIVLVILVFVYSYSSKVSSISATSPVPAKTDSISMHEFKNAGENENCLKCHGQSKYVLENIEMGKSVFKRMYSELIIDRDLFYSSNHRYFKCIDCHSEDYTTFPHPNNLRMESKASCIDCHGGDPQYAKYFFENIDTGFQASVHSQKHSQDFTCWMCHNPHTYKINARTNENITKTIIYDNNICLSCHSDYRKYELLTEKENPNILSKHDWLPNQELHFASVRCIECHTKKKTDSALIAHQILPKTKALKNCKECHSVKSELLSTLYKYQAQEVRSTGRLFSGIFTWDTIVIGAARNYTLTWLSIIIFIGIIAGIIVHACIRYLKH
jgi:hypothetical protein